jgi:hypothetical protein
MIERARRLSLQARGLMAVQLHRRRVFAPGTDGARPGEVGISGRDLFSDLTLHAGGGNTKKPRAFWPLS